MRYEGGLELGVGCGYGFEKNFEFFGRLEVDWVGEENDFWVVVRYDWVNRGVFYWDEEVIGSEGLERKI